MKTIICTLAHKGDVVINTVRIFGGDRLIILHGIPDDKTKSEINKIKKTIPPNFIPSEYIIIDQYNIEAVIKNVSEIIVEEYTKGNEIEYDKITRLFYMTEEDNMIIDIPIIKWNLTEPKKLILSYVKHEINNLDKISKRMNLSRNMIYKHLIELESDGYVKKVGDIYKLTSKGNMIAHNMELLYKIFRYNLIKQFKTDEDLIKLNIDDIENKIIIKNINNDYYLDIDQEIVDKLKCPNCRDTKLDIYSIRSLSRNASLSIKQIKCKRCRCRFNIHILE
ncbi:MAG: winged helix-turn-helix domain-containing protein [Candidatus Helarchaeota archaeon]